MLLTPGSRLGPYEILAPLGAGGMGEVYKAKDPRLGREVAIKVLPAGLTDDAEAMGRFEREAKALAALQHPNILAIHDVGHEAGVGYLVMELLEGMTLRERLEQGRVPPQKTAELGAAVAHGLAAAHGRNLIHRDLKPENIFLTRDGRVKILDFGLAKAHAVDLGDGGETLPLSKASAKTKEGVLLGTVGYMSPEQIQGQALDPRTDLFSLGVVLHEMLSGGRPFSGPSAIDTLHAILREDPPDLCSISAGVPLPLARIIRRCLEKDRDLRSQSARDVAFELESLSFGSSASGPQALAAPGPRWKRLAGPALLAALGAGALLGWLFHPGPPGQPTYTQLTFRRGLLDEARFTPDGNSAIYSAAWDGGPLRLYQVSMDGSAPRDLGIQDATVESVNAQGEVLTRLSKGTLAFTDAASSRTGTLAIVPVGGGTPKPLLEEVHAADFGPDGRSIAVAYHPDGNSIRVDYPLGHTLLEEGGGEVTEARVAPDGAHVAVLRSSTPTDPGRILLLDAQGKRRTLLSEIQTSALRGLCWSPDGAELWYARGPSLWALDLRGRERLLRREASPEALLDVARNGAILLARRISQVSTYVRRGGQDTDLSISPRSRLNGLSNDGGLVLMNLLDPDGARALTRPAVRKVDGSPATYLGQGYALDFHPQGTWSVVTEGGTDGSITLIPTGAGLPRRISRPGYAINGAFFTASGRSLILFAAPKGGSQRLFKVPSEGGDWKELAMDSSAVTTLITTPDDAALLTLDAQLRPVLRPLEGGADKVLGSPLAKDEAICGWDGQDRLVVGPQRFTDAIPMSLVDLRTGTRSPWQKLELKEAPGTARIWGAVLSRDLGTVAYSVTRNTGSDLFLAQGLK
jgi:hypothetical protein